MTEYSHSLGLSRKKMKHSFALFILLSFILLTNSIFRVYSDESEPNVLISETENAIEDAYLSVLEVEMTGGDVSELVLLLNTALEYLSEAEKAIESGDFDASRQMARRAADTSNVVIEAVYRMMYVEGRLEKEAFRNKVLTSIVSIIIISLSGFFGWKLFKNLYFRRIPGLKPEVISDEYR